MFVEFNDGQKNKSERAPYTHGGEFDFKSFERLPAGGIRIGLLGEYFSSETQLNGRLRTGVLELSADELSEIVKQLSQHDLETGSRIREKS